MFLSAALMNNISQFRFITVATNFVQFFSFFYLDQHSFVQHNNRYLDLRQSKYLGHVYAKYCTCSWLES